MTGKEAFSIELQEMEFFSEYLGAIAEIGSEFAWKVKERGNLGTARLGKNKIDDLARLVHNQNAVHKNSKASQKVALKTIRSK